MNINKTITVFLLLFSLAAAAQKNVSVTKSARNLTVGDPVPDILISKIINDDRRSARISDFSNQLLILDFWATTCKGCVAALPRMDELQKKFGSKVKILPVTYEKEQPVQAFLKKNKFTKDLVVPSVVEDKTLSKWFKHQFIPHEVWIYKKKIIAITTSDYVTAANIQAVLDGRKNNWLVKNDFAPALDYKKPLMKIDTSQYFDKHSSIRYVAILGYRDNPGFGGNSQGTTFDSLRNTRRDYFINYSIPLAYFIFWHKLRNPSGKTDIPMMPDPNRVVLEVKDPSRYLSFEETGGYLDVWQQEHLICYESVSPDTGQTETERAKSIIADLDHLLGLQGRYEKRKIKSLVLVRTTEEDKLKSAGGIQETNFEGPVQKFRNASLAEIIRNLNQHSANPPSFDETHYSGKVDLDLTIDSWTDIPALRKAIQAYGLDLKEEERMVEMFVLTEKNR